MAFSTYKTTRSVVKDFQIFYAKANFINENLVLINPYFQEELQSSIRDGIVDNSEYAIRESLIFPILREVWKSYKEDFLLWSHETFKYDDQLCGVPDYILATRSPLGKIVLDQPYVLIVEAKQDNFDEGWAQCVAAMLAAQKLNEKSDQTIFGIVSNGKNWEFGKLVGDRFAQNEKIYYLQELETLFAAINDVFYQCQLQIKNVQIKNDES